MIISEDKKMPPGNIDKSCLAFVIFAVHLCKFKKSLRIGAALACFSASNVINRMNVNVETNGKIEQCSFYN